MAPAEVDVIYPRGDLMLCSGGDDERLPHIRYRVSAEKVQAASQYFSMLLKPGFHEGSQYVEQATTLFKKYDARPWEAPDNELPTAPFTLPEEFGASNVAMTAARGFLQLIHGTEPELKDRMAVAVRIGWIADAFGAIDSTKESLTNFLNEKYKLHGRAYNVRTMSVKEWRQGLYLAYLYEHESTFSLYSSLLIEHHPHAEPTEGERSNSMYLPWMNLPNGIEGKSKLPLALSSHNVTDQATDELKLRRDRILSIIAAVPSVFLQPYARKWIPARLICSMGMGNSIECDSFQFGEALRWLAMKRFLTPKLLLDFNALAEDDDAVPLWTGTLTNLIKELKMMPEYQIDKHHKHCGISKSMRQCLDGILSLVSKREHVGLCPMCWRRWNDPGYNYNHTVRWASHETQPVGPDLPAALTYVARMITIAPHSGVEEHPADGACGLAEGHRWYATVFSGGNIGKVLGIVEKHT